ncbi:PIN domain-containing protein [Mesorhizobium sp. WSM4904]|uniref:PIN domain-containing protein n=1 Tax=Mesorhizobium sp. WSM4904 TaxID=3038545 RepID=UPI0024188A6A|nr:PIN domain-containing protein [Mesorhizobium sp. WSM4904]WFP61237.1 PIN domain-containing protein [Mesorhizobium sp. WSM4904]
MKVAIDTNVLAYAEGVNDVQKRGLVLDLLHNVPQEAAIIPVQVLGELFNVLVRKAGRSPQEARDALLGWSDAYRIAGTTPEVMTMAVDLAADHRFGIWDAVILSAASQTGCRLLLSEDLQDGFTWGGVTVVNPFASPRHALLDALLAAA